MCIAYSKRRSVLGYFHCVRWEAPPLGRTGYTLASAAHLSLRVIKEHIRRKESTESGNEMLQEDGD